MPGLVKAYRVNGSGTPSGVLVTVSGDWLSEGRTEIESLWFVVEYEIRELSEESYPLSPSSLIGRGLVVVVDEDYECWKV